MSTRKGIDVYNGTGNVDWNLVKEAGYDFTMIKASEGYTLADKRMSENLTNAAVAGLHTGVYHWTHAVSTEEAAREATHFLNLVRGCKMEYPVALDVEQDTILRLPRDSLTDVVMAWCRQVANAGYYVAIYANLNVLRNHLDWSRIKEFDLWLAQYNTQMSSEFPASIWQYTDKGRVPGVKNGTGDVDLNLSFKDYPEIIRKGGFNNYPAPPPIEEDTPLSLDTRSKDMSPGEIYTVLARCDEKPEVTVTGRDVIRAAEPRLDAKGRGWLIDVTALKPPVRHAHIQVRSKDQTANCNFNVL
ncbi:MAG: glycoside hydrolase family 25 protein [Clostridium sp.]|uniref:glycoside hydrolase family 25 protein n=1 Tax=Clostridium sp. TaxID=1506 RepID=UPI0029084992|nr:glycoside hydrolase family 25 protein [Clostridium sp.]MDU7337375.1 glycoside hydrolase family 25 protein [Clostridium sp.]